MADFTALKTAIQNAIKQNGNEEITGNLLQEVLLAIVTTLGDGSINDLITALGSEATTRQQADGTLQQNINAEAQARQQGDSTLQGGINTAMQAINAINNAIGNGCVYAGIATPSTTPAAGKVFYLALTAGTYTNFNGLEVSQGINILKNNGSTWSLDSFVGIDDAPAPSSQKLVKSGGVFDEVMKNGSAFDLSAYNGGATYADLNAALTALNALPAAYKRGGMSMKFVLTSDNKYVQFRLMPNSFTTDVTDWQGVDSEPIAGSKNLVESSGVFDNVSVEKKSFNITSSTFNNFSNFQGTIDEENNVITSSATVQDRVFYFKVNKSDKIRVHLAETESSWSSYFVAGFSLVVPINNTPVTNIVNTGSASAEVTHIFTAPYDGYICVYKYLGGRLQTLDVAVYELCKELTEDYKPFKGENMLLHESFYWGYYNKTQGFVSMTSASNKSFISDYIDVHNVKELIVKSIVYDGRSDAAKILTYNSQKELITNDIFYGSNPNEVRWEKPVNVYYVRIGYNIDYEYYCIQYPNINTLNKIADAVILDNDNLISQAKIIDSYRIANDGTLTATGGSTGGVPNWSVAKGIYVANIHKLRIKSSAYGTWLNVAAYDENGTLLTNLCKVGDDYLDTEFIWENDGTAAYIDIAFSKLREHYCYIYPLYKDVVDYNNLKDVIDIRTCSAIKFNNVADWTLKLMQANYHSTNVPKPVSLLHFSDIHADKFALERIIAFKEYYKQYIDDIINTGDTVGSFYGDSFGIAWYNDAVGADKILTIIGNHDTASYNGTYDWFAHIGTDAYNAYIKPNVAEWGVEQPDNAEQNGYCYYYKDYDAQNLRLICVDCMGYDAAQNTWVAALLTEARTNNMSVVIALHNTSPYISYVESSFTNAITSYEGAAWGMGQNLWETVQDFIDKGGKFMCYICGHWHNDIIAIGRDYPKQLQIYVANAGNASVDYKARVPDKLTQMKALDDFNIVSFDTTLNMIKLVKVGCQYNAAMQHTDTLCAMIDYEGNEKYKIIE